jgi:hypothetical protein
LAHAFGGASPWIVGPVAFRPVARHYVIEEAGTNRGSPFTSWWPEAKREKRRWVPTIPFKATPPMTSPPPARPHLLMAPSPPNSTMGWGTSTHRPLEDISDPNYSTVQYLFYHFLEMEEERRKKTTSSPKGLECAPAQGVPWEVPPTQPNTRNCA